MSLFVRDVDTDTDVATNAPDITAANTELADAQIPIAIGDPAVPSAMSVNELLEYIFSQVSTWLAAGSNVTITPGTNPNSLTIASTDTNTDTDTQLSEEEVYQYVAGFFANTNSITVTKDDTDTEITLASPAPTLIIDRHSSPIGSTKDGSNPDYVEINGLSLSSATYRWYTAVCRLREDDDDFEDGSGNDINLGWSYASTTVPSHLFNSNLEKIRVDTKDNSWAIVWYQSSSTVRVFVREADDNECKFVALYGQK